MAVEESISTKTPMLNWKVRSVRREYSSSKTQSRAGYSEALGIEVESPHSVVPIPIAIGRGTGRGLGMDSPTEGNANKMYQTKNTDPDNCQDRWISNVLLIVPLLLFECSIVSRTVTKA